MASSSFRAGVVAAVQVDGSGAVTKSAISFLGMAPTPVRAPSAEAALIGQPATEESFAAAAKVVGETCEPYADQRGPVDYKRHLATELTLRALRRAARASQGA